MKLYADTKKYDEAAKEADVCILFYHWRKGVRLGAHFVALQYVDGHFVGYNTYSNSTGPDPYGPSLEAHIQRHGWFATSLTTIQQRDSR